MSKYKLIKINIKRIPRGKPFFAESISTEYSTKKVSRVLSRLTKAGEIMRVTRGMYVRPRKSRYFKGIALVPGFEEIIKAISKKTGELISMHGAVADNVVGLTTQVPVRPMYYTTGHTRRIEINKKSAIRLVHVSAKKVVMPGTVTCLVITALWYRRSLGGNLITPLVIKKIHHRIGEEHFAGVLKHIDKMPVWMKKMFVQYQNMQLDDPLLIEDWSSYYQG
jgi:hypothetical protein